MPEIIEGFCIETERARQAMIASQVAAFISLWSRGKRRSFAGFRNGVRP